MKEPTFPKPVGKMKDEQIIFGMNRVLNFFHRRAKEDRAQGDLFGGWDWPTMNIVYPDVCAKYREMRAEAEKRLNATGGKFNGLQYTKTEKGWKYTE